MRTHTFSFIGSELERIEDYNVLHAMLLDFQSGDNHNHVSVITPLLRNLLLHRSTVYYRPAVSMRRWLAAVAPS